jgi:pyruvate dehydrogenase E2 component (dihydrolipoamide acetyltransferase)
MAKEFKLPDPGEGIQEAEILEVCVAPGDVVQEGEIVLHIETDKAAIEVPSPFTGVVEEIRVTPGDVIQVGEVLMTFAAQQAPHRQRQGASDETVVLERPAGERDAASVPSRARAKQNELPVPASPATRRLAFELDVDLHEVSGSGPGGRVTAEDVRACAAKPQTPRLPPSAQEEAEDEVAAPEERVVPPQERPLVVDVPPLPDFSRWGPVESVPLRSVRRATARQMTLAWSQIPHVMHQDVADITALEAFRQRHAADVERQGGKLTLTVLVMLAVAAVLKHFPRFNASLDAASGQLILKQYYHIGVAVDTERGLIVPVVRDVDCKSITELAVELSALVERLRHGQVKREELQGGTFTITNPGAIGGTAVTPIIHYPEVAILGLARTRLEPVIQGDIEDFTVVARWHLALHLAFDHRVNDGADAARFMRTLIDMLGDPELFLINV